MLQWIEQHSGQLTLLANTGMLLVWILYLQLFWHGFRRQLRANILINRGAGVGLDARCLVSNMSHDSVFIEGIILVLRKGNEEWSATTTNMTGLTEEGEEPSYLQMHKGPLASGNYMDIGRFRDLFEAAFNEVPGLHTLDKGKTPEFDQFAIWVVADYGPENRVVSVRRNFKVTRSGDSWLLRPENVDTEQVRSGKARRRIEQLLEEKLTG